MGAVLLDRRIPVIQAFHPVGENSVVKAVLDCSVTSRVTDRVFLGVGVHLIAFFRIGSDENLIADQMIHVTGFLPDFEFHGIKHAVRDAITVRVFSCGRTPSGGFCGIRNSVPIGIYQIDAATDLDFLGIGQAVAINVRILGRHSQKKALWNTAVGLAEWNVRPEDGAASDTRSADGNPASRSEICGGKQSVFLSYERRPADGGGFR